MISLVFVTPDLSPGGLQHHLVRLTNALVKIYSLQIAIIIVGQRADLGALLDPSIKVHILHGRTRNPFTMFSFVNLLNTLRPTILVGWSIYPSLLCLMLRMNYKKMAVVATELSYPPAAYGFDEVGFNLLRVLVRKLYRHADLVTANSAGTVQYLAKLLAGTRTARIFNVLALTGPACVSGTQEAPTAWGSARLRVLAAGRLFNRAKGFDVLLRSIAIMRRSYRDFHLLLLGDGPDRRELESLAEELAITDIVTFPGWVEDPQHVFAKADVFVLPSNHEGFPNVLIEAMQAGAIVVSTNLPSGPREVIEHSRNGYLVPIGDEVALAETMLEVAQLSTAQKQEMLKAAQAVIAKFLPEHAARAYYNEVIAQVTSHRRQM